MNDPSNATALVASPVSTTYASTHRLYMSMRRYLGTLLPLLVLAFNDRSEQIGYEHLAVGLGHLLLVAKEVMVGPTAGISPPPASVLRFPRSAGTTVADVHRL